jgi:hypothetical protein
MYVNGKMIPIETFPGIGGERIKENGGGGEFEYNIFDTLLSAFVSATVHPHGGQQ